jgi:hypothetical protein
VKAVRGFCFQTKMEKLASLKPAWIDKFKKKVVNALSAAITHIQMMTDSNA